MDFVEGHHLADFLSQGHWPMTGQEALNWFGQVYQALAYLHGEDPPVIHRDIKPQNIIITREGKIMLVDFGISKILDPRSEITAGSLKVTSGFSPPEQYQRGPTDARSDIYSLGATLFYSLTKQIPPDAIKRYERDDLPGLTQQITSELFKQAILKAMNLNVETRFKSVEEFHTMLNLGVSGSPTQLVTTSSHRVGISIVEERLEGLWAKHSQNWFDKQLEIGKKTHNILLKGQNTDFISDNNFLLELVFMPNELHRRLFCFPYELIADRGGDRQLCLQGGSLVRVLDIPTRHREPLPLPVNILIVVASPYNLDPINGDDEIQNIREALGAYDGMLARLDIVKEAGTLQKITDKVKSLNKKGEWYHIVHLIAHGDDSALKGGVVYLEDKVGEKTDVDGNELGACLKKGSRSPSLVILNSCLTAGSKKTPLPGQFSNVAWHLLNNGIPAVVAMQTEVETNSAPRSAAAFYENLFLPGSLDACVAGMRHELKEWYAPILATRAGFDRNFFTKEWRDFLKKMNRINQDIAKLIDNDEALVTYVKEVGLEYYPLLHKRDDIARKILSQVKANLEIMG